MIRWASANEATLVRRASPRSWAPDRRVEVEHQVLEPVRPPLLVAARVVGQRRRLFREQGGVAQELLVGPVAPPDPELVRALLVPRERGDPRVDLEHHPVPPSRRDLRDGEDARAPVVHLEEHVREVLGVDGDRLRVRVAAAVEGLHVPGRAQPLVVEAAETGMDTGHPAAGDVLDQVDPVRPDVAQGPRGAGSLRLEPPVPVGLVEQPVLEIGAPDQVRPADAPVGEHRARLRDQRVVAVVEADAAHGAGPGCPVDEIGGLRASPSRAASRPGRAFRPPAPRP